MIAVATLSLATPAFSQVDLSPGEVAFTDDRRWVLQFFGAGIIDATNRDTQMFGPGVAVGYHLLDSLSANLEFGGLRVFGEDEDGSAYTVTFIGRHHVLDFNAGASTLFVDVGGGYVRTDDRVPADGTHSNYSFHCGPGLTHRIADGVYLMGAARFYHLSNADRKGDDRNPSINGPMFVAGVMFTF